MFIILYMHICRIHTVYYAVYIIMYITVNPFILEALNVSVFSTIVFSACYFCVLDQHQIYTPYMLAILNMLYIKLQQCETLFYHYM